MNVSGKIKSQARDFAIDQLNTLNLPKSFLIIPDGNGRWAKSRGLQIFQGHEKGGETISEILDGLLGLNVEVIGIWGFSEDNWKRPIDEIDKIMEVIENVIKQNLQKMIDNNIKFLVLGKKDKIKQKYPSLYQQIQDAMSKTSQDNGKILALFVDYGERFQLEEFAKARKENETSTAYELLSKINSGLPLFDMVLRTSGEMRLSGFGPLSSIAEFVSVKKNLPVLSIKDIADALIEYSKRQRRFGARTT